MAEIEIKAEMRFKDGNVSFRVIKPTDGKPGFWDVQQSLPSAGFMRTKPAIKSFSEGQIRKLAEGYLGMIGTCGMRTVGIASGRGERPRIRREIRPRNQKTASVLLTA